MHTGTHPHGDQRLVETGAPLEEATSAMILIHGRGAAAPNILELAAEFPVKGMRYFAPQANGNTWYPYSFLQPMEANQPGLDSGLQRIGEIVEKITAAGIPAEKIVFGGFSQGACLASEFVARNAKRYGGLFVFSGGLIGPPGTPRDYAGSVDEMPVFLGCSDIDFHVPLERVQETTATFNALNGNVIEHIYPNFGHSINMDEIQHVKDHILASL